MFSAVAAASTLDRLNPVSQTAEQDAARIIQKRLKEAGPPPYSLCEARLTESEYNWLLTWAKKVLPGSFQGWSSLQQQFAGLVLLTLLAEWNRRESDGDAVYQGIPELFQEEETRHTLFFDNGNARQLVRDLFWEAAHAFELRHAFGTADATKFRWYMTVHLQFGFCSQQIPRVTDWLCGLPTTEAMQRLLAPAGPQRSRSFQRLLADLKYFRRRYIPEVVARRELEQNHWILPEWIPALLEAARASSGGMAEEEAETEPELASRVSLRWRSERGPIVRLTLAELHGRFDRAADRYHLRCGSQLLATWLRQPSVAGDSQVEYRVDNENVELDVRGSEVVLRLEDETGESITTQSIPIWNPTEDVQYRRLRIHPDGQQSWRAGSDMVVLVRRDYVPSQEPDEWFLTGYNTPFERRWLRYSSAPAELRVQDSDGQIAWEAVTAPIPKWAQTVNVCVVPEQEPLVFGGWFSLEIGTASGINVEWAVGNGKALRFDTQSRCAGPIQLHVETAISGYKLRIGLERDGVRIIHRVAVPVQCRGSAQQTVGQGIGGSWRWQRGDKLLSLQEAGRDLFRIFSDGPELLLEGFEVLGRREMRARRLSKLLGTGAPLDLAPSPFHVQDDERLRIAKGVVDFGDVAKLSGPRSWPGSLRVELVRPYDLREGHFVLLWSNRHGVKRIEWDAIQEENQGRAWTLDCPWPDQPEAMLAAVGYDGYRLGFGWDGQWHRFFSPGCNDHLSLTPRQVLGLIRWLRLPGLLENKYSDNQPILQEFAHGHIADLLAVAVLEQGLQNLPGIPQLYFQRGVKSHQAFDAIVRQILLDCPLSDIAAQAIEDSFGFHHSHDPCHLLIEHLFPFHPVLAARVLRATWLRRITEGERLQVKMYLCAMRFHLAGTTANSQAYRDRLEAPRNDQSLSPSLRARAIETFSENNRQTCDEYFIDRGIVLPATRFALADQSLGPLDRHNLLIALGSGDFRLYLALRLLEGLENRI